ncbi:MAG TPA: hypothetical protein PK878_03215 [bacterium]|nr:hypothetical protein [bacterium]HOL94656.1 hypothetical protein [bacterium]HPP03074.1 hypothetical protein [bacterium]
MQSKFVHLGLMLVVFAGMGLAQDLPPYSLDVAKLTRIVPDTVVYNTGTPNLDNWEPYTSVLGNSVFLIESNTFAEGSTTDQRYVLTFQPVAGGSPAFGECFFADDGTPYRGKINNYRQNGNPGRVAGDKRPGAVNFITGGEASPDEFPEFQSDNRWNTGVIRNGRYGTVQIFSLNPTTLVQTPLTKAFDAINGRLTSGNPNTDQISRFGGELAALDDGNFLVVVEDRSKLFYDAGNAAVAAIFRPDGSLVKDSFVVAPGDIWSNVCAYKGGFCVRVAGVLYFYDNAGNLKGQVQQNVEYVTDVGRGDGVRIASHINSPFVYLAGFDGNEAVRVVVYDSRTLEFVTETHVNEIAKEYGGQDDVDFLGEFDRVGIAVDALNRIFIAWELNGLFPKTQIVGRVLKFDDNTKTLTHLTPSFIPFLNTSDNPTHRTIRVNVSMTTKQLLVAAKGEINSQNNPDADADVPAQTTIYTVLSHPDPQDDPTPPVSGTNVVEWSLY